MPADQFFGAEHHPVDHITERLADWDGTPRVRMADEQANELLALVPHFHACVLGPVPFGGDPEERIKITVDFIVAPNLDIAEQMVWQKVAQACDAYKHPLVPEEWDILHVLANNCS